MFPAATNGFQELSLVALTEDRLKKAEKHLKNCPNTKFVYLMDLLGLPLLGPL